MKLQTLALFLCTLIAASACGIAYAQWNDVIEIHSTMEFGTNTLRFVDSPECWDNEDTKDVGECVCQYEDYDSGGYNATVVTIGSAYPGYEGYCNFTIQNVGTLLNHIKGVRITPGTGLEVGYNYTDANGNPTGWQLNDSNTGEPAIYVYVYNVIELSLVCNRVVPKGELDGTIIIQVADGAGECQTYSFKVKIIYEV